MHPSKDNQNGGEDKAWVGHRLSFALPAAAAGA
jgi:hypothetical protein